MADFDVEWVRDSDALARFVAEIYAAADANFRAAVSLEDYRHQFEQDPVVLARRNGGVIAWVQIRDRPRDGTLPAKHVVPFADDKEAAALKQVLLAAVASSGGEGICWAATTGDIQQRVAADVGATLHRELFRIWHSPEQRWPSLAALPPASTLSVRPPLSDELLSRYARFYTAANVKRCGETSCTTAWDESMIAEDLSERDASVYTEVLCCANELVAEIYALTWENEMCIVPTLKDASNTTGLTTLIGTLLRRVQAANPTIHLAIALLQEEELATIGPAFAEAGFEETGRRAVYHLQPDVEPAAIPG